MESSIACVKLQPLIRAKFHRLLPFKRAGIELVIGAFFRNQLVVIAPLDNAALIQDHDHIGVLNGGQSVGDGDRLSLALGKAASRMNKTMVRTESFLCSRGLLANVVIKVSFF